MRYLKSLRAENTFLAYTADHWADHVRPVQHRVKKQALRFLCNDYIRVRIFRLSLRHAHSTRSRPIEDITKFTALHFAAFAGLDILLSELITEHNSQDLRDVSGRTPLVCAVRSGYAATTKLLLSKSRHYINEEDNIGRTPLFHAIHTGQMDVVKMLIDEGANVNHESSSNGNAAQFACSFRPTNAFQSVDMLLHEHADMIGRDPAIRQKGALSLRSSIDLISWPLTGSIDVAWKG